MEPIVAAAHDLVICRFTPTLPCILYHGTPDQRAHLRKKRMAKLDNTFPIVVTSYEIVMNDRKYLQVSVVLVRLW
jgi:ATP-dependent DNA helicase